MPDAIAGIVARSQTPPDRQALDMQRHKPNPNPDKGADSSAGGSGATRDPIVVTLSPEAQAKMDSEALAAGALEAGAGHADADRAELIGSMEEARKTVADITAALGMSPSEAVDAIHQVRDPAPAKGALIFQARLMALLPHGSTDV